jgi:hypothetical protein
VEVYRQLWVLVTPSDVESHSHILDVLLSVRVRLGGGSRRCRAWCAGVAHCAGEAAVVCRLVDGTAGTIAARWRDLPPREAVRRRRGVVGTPAAWRLLGERLEGLRAVSPGRDC